MSFDPDDITARTLLKGFLATEVPKSTVKRQCKRRASELERLYPDNDISISRNINLLSPSRTLRRRMKEKIRRSVDKTTGSAKRHFTDKGVSEKHLLGLGPLPSQYDLDKDTPRTILKKIIQTENEVSMLVMERPKDGECEQTREEPIVKTTHLGVDKLEMNVLEPPVHRTASGLSRTRTKKKRVSVSQFERCVEEKLPQIQENEERLEDHNENIMALANISAMSRSLKTSLSIPSMPESIEKRGLFRRPKKHRIISVEDFEEGIKQNLMHLKGSQDCFVESVVTNADGSMLPSSAPQINTEIVLSNTELFVKSQPKQQILQELSQPRSPSLLSMFKQSLKSPSVHKGNVSREELTILDALEPEIMIQRKVDAKREAAQMEGVEEENEEGSYLNVDLEKASMTEGVEEKNEESNLVIDMENKVALIKKVEEKRSNSADSAENEMVLTKRMERDLEQMDRIISTVKNRTENSKSYRSFRKRLYGTEKLVDSVFHRSEEPINVSGHTLAIFPLFLEEVSRTSINKTASPVLPGSDVEAEAEENNTLQDNGRWQEEDDGEEELLETEQITGNVGSSTGVPRTSAVSVKATPFNLHKNSGHRSTPYSVKTYMNLVSADTCSTGKRAMRDKNDTVSHGEEEEDHEKQVTEDEELSLDKNVFLRINDIKFSPAFPTPHYLKTTSLKFPKKPPFAKLAPVRTDKALSRTKKEPAFPSRLIKQIFSHYAKIPVTKDSFKTVEKCLDAYFKQLSNDLEAFAGHAKRKIVNATDIELLMRRQGLVTDKMPLHVLIERHLPLEHRRLLIPVAMSGNKVIPKK